MAGWASWSAPSILLYKGKRKRLFMATPDHQPLKRRKTSSSSMPMPTPTPTSSTAWGRWGELPNDTLTSTSSTAWGRWGELPNDIPTPMPTPTPTPSSRWGELPNDILTPTSSTAWGRWGELPNDILSLILQKLILQDHMRLSCVCVPWNLAVRGVGGLGRRPSPKPQLPWLIIPGAGRDPTSAKFISLSEHRTYDIPLPHPPIGERLCFGSSHGWLITLYKLSEMHLLNPITGVQVPLPAITTTLAAAATYPAGYIRIGSPRNFGPFFGKAILSSAPSRDGTGDFTIFLIRGMPGSSLRTLAIARIGDDAWTTFADEYILDIMYHNGQLHCMGAAGRIHIWEQQKHSFVPRFTICTGDFHHNNIPLKTIRSPRNYLVPSMTGELYMLIRTSNLTREGPRFQFAQLDLDRNEYVPVDDLKDLVFFVGVNDPIIVSATKFPEVKRNCVYFTKHEFMKVDDGISAPTIRTCISNGNIGVFDVEKKERAELLDMIGSHLSWEEKKHMGSLLNLPPPTWIIPTLF